MIKLIITDIDDTLAPAGSTALNPAYFEVFEDLMRKGVRVAAASGRHMTSIKKILTPVIDKIDVISQGGGVIRCNGEEEVMKPIPTEWVRGIWKDISAYKHLDLDTCVLTATDAYVPFLGTEMSDLLGNSYKYDLTPFNSWENIPEKDYSVITIYCPKGIRTFFDNSTVREKWEDKLIFSISGLTWTDIHQPGNDKGSSFLKLCKKLGIDPADTVAFGDNGNDITMIKNAGFGYAVENAQPELKAVADQVIPGYTEDGVLKKLQEIAAQL